MLFRFAAYLTLFLLASNLMAQEAVPKTHDLRSLITEPFYRVGETFMRVSRDVAEMGIRINVGEEKIELPYNDVAQLRFQSEIVAIDSEMKPLRLKVTVFYAHSGEEPSIKGLTGKTLFVQVKGTEWVLETPTPGVSDAARTALLDKVRSPFVEYEELESSLPQGSIAVGQTFPASKKMIQDLVNEMTSDDEMPMTVDLNASKLTYTLVDVQVGRCVLDVSGKVIFKLNMDGTWLNGSFEVSVSQFIDFGPYRANRAYVVGIINAAGNTDEMLVKMSGELEMIERSFTLNEYKTHAAKANAYAQTVYDKSDLSLMLRTSRDSLQGAVSQARIQFPKEAPASMENALSEVYEPAKLRKFMITELSESYDDRFADKVLAFYSTGQGREIAKLLGGLPNTAASNQLIMEYMNKLENAPNVTTRSEHLGYYLYSMDVIPGLENLTVDTTMDVMVAMADLISEKFTEDQLSEMEVEVRNSVKESLSEALIYKYYYLFRNKDDLWLKRLAEFSRSRAGIWAGETIYGALANGAGEIRRDWAEKAHRMKTP